MSALFHVDSEVGQLRRILLHRPDLELRRLTPSNVEDLLFDEVLWARRARQEHDAFADTLVERGVEVLYLADLLAEVVKEDTGRSWLLERVVNRDDLGIAADDCRAALAEMDPSSLARHLIGGITRVELGLDLPGLRGRALRDHDFVLPPLPNHLFTRDTSCWIYDGVSVNPMARSARRREARHLEAIYRFHPLFASSNFHIWYGGGDDPPRAATIEGGDVLVLGQRAVVIGMGERTTAQAVEQVALALFAAGSADRVIAV